MSSKIPYYHQANNAIDESDFNYLYLTVVLSVLMFFFDYYLDGRQLAAYQKAMKTKQVPKGEEKCNFRLKYLTSFGTSTKRSNF